MASNSLRKEVLNTFKLLHRTRQKVFEGDELALTFAREKINEEYKKCKQLTEIHEIAQKVDLAKNVENEMRTTIVQAKEVRPGVYEAKLNPHTVKLENVPFKDCDTQIEFSTKKKEGKQVEDTCCKQQQ